MNSKQEIYDNISAILTMYEQGLADGQDLYNGNSKQVGGYYPRRLSLWATLVSSAFIVYPKCCSLLPEKLNFLTHLSTVSYPND